MTKLQQEKMDSIRGYEKAKLSARLFFSQQRKLMKSKAQYENQFLKKIK